MTVKDILDKKFGRSFFGYDPQQVDGFLDDIIDQMEAHERERQEMLTAMEYLLKEIEQYESSGAAEQQKEARKEKRKSEAALKPFQDPRKRTPPAEESPAKPEPPAPQKRKETPGKPSFLILPEEPETEEKQPEDEDGEVSLIDQLLRDFPPEGDNGGDGQ